MLGLTHLPLRELADSLHDRASQSLTAVKVLVSHLTSPQLGAASALESASDSAGDPLQTWRQIARRNIVGVALFSVFVNLLMLTMPIYLFQISDRVLTSHSLDTLVMLSLVALGFIAVLSLLDTVRRQVLGRLATRMETTLGGPVLASVVSLAPATDGGSILPLRQLHQVRSFIASPTMLVLFDAPLAPLYFHHPLDCRERP
jgi:ATP-binding cassette subfamily C protein